MKITVKAQAKINLSLGVCERTASGYHNIETVMQTISLADKVTVERTDGGTEVFTGDPQIDRDPNNTALAAAREFFEYTKIDGGAKIEIEKHIPKAAGLGGGSADAAAVINSLDLLYGTGLSDENLRAIALNVGSDVPFCISGGTAHAKGQGEKLTPLPPLPFCYFVLAIKGQKQSTGEMYRKIDCMTSVKKPDTAEIVSAIIENRSGIFKLPLVNTFEELYDSGDVEELKNIFHLHGAETSALSGAGPTVYGIFTEKELAEKCLEKLKTRCRFSGIFTPEN